MLNLDHYTEAINEICVRLSVKHLRVFGSSLRDDFDSETSDVDFCYQFEGTEDIFKRFMKHDSRAYLHDIISAAESIARYESNNYSQIY